MRDLQLHDQVITSHLPRALGGRGLKVMMLISQRVPGV